MAEVEGLIRLPAAVLVVGSLMVNVVLEQFEVG